MAVAPYGSWLSPITPEFVVAAGGNIANVAVEGDVVAWLEPRPAEAGRQAIMVKIGNGAPTELLPAPLSARDRAHEYGGGAMILQGGAIIFSNDADARLYRIPVTGGVPTPLTPDLPGRVLRYADMAPDPTRGRIVAVREDHRAAGEARNEIVAIALDGSSVADGGAVLVSGPDFVSNPTVNLAGDTIAWLSWTHPDMPWDRTDLWTASLDVAGKLGAATHVAGGPIESVFQPRWSPEGALVFASDRDSGWWNLHVAGPTGPRNLCPREAEFAYPQWVFGLSIWCWANARTIVSTSTRDGLWNLVRIDVTTGASEDIVNPYTEIDELQAGDGWVTFVGRAPDRSAELVRYDLATGALAVIAGGAPLGIDASYIARPETFWFSSTGDLPVHALYYPPTNPDFRAPDDEAPPLVVLSHGGPTSIAHTALNLKTQYWTSRGFAVLDVNYGGSTGFGRPYRERLRLAWGVVDVDDCVNAARAMAERGFADPERVMIRGWSASGYTTLAALAFRNVFKAGASHFGISDLETMATDTHKFESRYLDRLIGPYPAAKHVYVARSPIHAADHLSCPLILFQGLEDKVVPPDQAEKMYDAVRARGIPVAYVPFAGEQHGFRQAANIMRSLEAELYFLSRVFHFPLPTSIDPVEIANADAL